MTEPRRQLAVYISGPMTGLPEYNYPAFHSAARALERAGHLPLNPATSFAGDTTHPRAAYMRRDLEMLLQADAVVVLAGWQSSKGATLEVTIAEELALPVFTIEALTN